MARDKKNATPFQLWFEEAWEGWIRPLGLIVLLAIGYVLYKFDIVSEHVAGVAAVLAIVVGAIVVGALPARPLVQKPWQRALLVAMVAAALGGMVYPSVRAAVPGRLYAEARPDQRQAVADADDGRGRPVRADGLGPLQGGRPQRRRGDVQPQSRRQRRRQRRGLGRDRAQAGDDPQPQGLVVVGDRAERGEAPPRPRRSARKVTLTADGVDEQLESGLAVSLRPGGLDPIIFIILGALAMRDGARPRHAPRRSEGQAEGVPDGVR